MDEPYYDTTWLSYQTTGEGWRIDTRYGYTITGKTRQEVIDRLNAIKQGETQ